MSAKLRKASLILISLVFFLAHELLGQNNLKNDEPATMQGENHQQREGYTQDPNFWGCAVQGSNFCPFCVTLWVHSAYQSRAFLEFETSRVHEYHLLGNENTRSISLGPNSGTLLVDYIVRMYNERLRTADTGTVGLLFEDAFGRLNYVDVWELSWDAMDRVNASSARFKKKLLVPFCGQESAKTSSNKDAKNVEETGNRENPRQGPQDGNAVLNMELSYH